MSSGRNRYDEKIKKNNNSGFSGKSTLYFQLLCLIHGEKGYKKLMPQYLSGIYHNLLMTTCDLGEHILKKGKKSLEETTVENLKKLEVLREIAGF
jgi:hypothetical protein